jgi:hypothetical protein
MIYPWQEKVLAICEDLNDDGRSIQWVHSEKGNTDTGKSTMTTTVIEHYGAALITNNNGSNMKFKS